MVFRILEAQPWERRRPRRLLELREPTRTSAFPGRFSPYLSWHYQVVLLLSYNHPDIPAFTHQLWGGIYEIQALGCRRFHSI